MARKNYSEEFRRQAVDLYQSTPGATLRGIAADLGISRAHAAGLGAGAGPGPAGPGPTSRGSVHAPLGPHPRPRLDGGSPADDSSGPPGGATGARRTSEYCYCRARRRYEKVELRLREDHYWLTLTLVKGGQWVVNRIVNTRVTADDALDKIERGHHYLHATDPQIHHSILPGNPVAARLLAIAALHSGRGLTGPSLLRRAVAEQPTGRTRVQRARRVAPLGAGRAQARERLIRSGAAVVPLTVGEDSGTPPAAGHAELRPPSVQRGSDRSWTCPSHPKWEVVLRATARRAAGGAAQVP